MKFIFTKSVIFFLFFSIGNFAYSQSHSSLDNALRYIKQNHEKWDLTNEDVTDMGISSQYKTDHNEVTHIYFIQRSQGIEVYNAILNANILPTGKILSVGNRFVPNLGSKVNTHIPILSASEAIQSAAKYLELPSTEIPRIKEQISDQEFLFEKGNISNTDIPVKLRFQPMEDGTVRLAWDLSIDMKKNADYWSLRVDAVHGEVLNQQNYTVYCQFENDYLHNHNASCRNEVNASPKKTLTSPTKKSNVGAQYRVFPIPVESPAHGDHVLIDEPSAPIASPFGWHDVNGITGEDFTITRGNNVHAYPDLDNFSFPLGDEPDGGADLIFDFPFNGNIEPEEQTAAAVVNLFYMNNVMHDFSYSFGFNEIAGNFQGNHYGNGNLAGAGDYIWAEAQNGLNLGFDNNASFTSPTDGVNGRMQMLVWNGAVGAFKHLKVESPLSIAGDYITGSTFNWGQTISSDNPVFGKVVIAEDGVNNPLISDACEDIQNGPEIEGNIALIDRAGCEYGLKAFNAQQEGAIGVIICNFLDSYLIMEPGQFGAQVNIPVVIINNSDCQLIRQFAGQGLEVTIVGEESVTPEFRDSDFDNGVIVHEYAHGISFRLTGGPQVNCLNQGERFDEGWSDFFALAMTTKSGDFGEMKRGIATYLQKEPNDGKGIRTYPYTTDLTINPHTYADLPKLNGIHAMGSIWCAMLWDMYWLFVEHYGWSADWSDMSAGNNIAVQLVMDGMKMQPCTPGFVDARDAILKADTAMAGGENSCLIWEAFAKRGLGYSADQGSSDSRLDGKETFDLHPLCVKELKITKKVTELVEAGNNIEARLIIVNHKEENLTNIVVTDEIPIGTSFIIGTSNFPGIVNGNSVSFELGEMSYLDEIEITYQLSTTGDQHSIQKWIEEVPDDNAEDNWDFYFVGDLASNVWQISNIIAYNSQNSWGVLDIETESRQVLELIEPQLIEGDQPVLRFYQYFNTQLGVDGGVLEISSDDGITWLDIRDKIFRNGYTGQIAYNSLFIPNFFAWSGDSGNFIPSYIDLSEFLGQELKIRFRFGTNDGIGGLGWWVDDIEFMDMLNYNGEACVTSDQGDMACTTAKERGTIVESAAMLDNIIDPESNVQVAIYPNPAQEYINVTISAPQKEEVNISLMTVDGKEVLAQKVQAIGTQTLPIAVRDLPSGFYFVKVSTEGGMVTEKVVVH